MTETATPESPATPATDTELLEQHVAREYEAGFVTGPIPVNAKSVLSQDALWGRTVRRRG